MRTRAMSFAATLALVSLSPLLRAQVPETQAPRTFGTAQVSYVRVPAAAFFPVNSSDGYSGAVGSPRSGPQGVNYFEAPVQIPSGAKPVSLELDFVDGSTIAAVIGSLLECDSLLSACTYHPMAGGGDPDCANSIPGFVCSGYAFQNGAGSVTADLSPDGMAIDNAGKYYMLVAETIASPLGAVAGMRVGYVLQVSPAPGSATFADVPTNHPFFQYVEALNASGITSGCGGGNFCPNNPLTRGQMAVFLAKALGLQWP